jgi:hypothetical protein
MPRTKSLVIRVEIDEAKIAHNCQANASHRIQRGSMRLKVRNGRSWNHYCILCAAAIIERDIAELQDLQRQVNLSKPLNNNEQLTL